MRATLLLAVLSLAALADEHVIIQPFPGSVAAGREVKQKQVTVLPGGPGKTLEVRGTLSRYVWKNPKGKAAGEIAASYEQQLTQTGFRPVYSCAGDECRGLDLKAFGKQPAETVERYSLAWLRRPELGDAYGALLVAKSQATLLILDQPATPEQKEAAAKEAVAVAQRMTAASVGESLGRDGHVALGDILYRPGEVALRPEALSVVKEIASLLKSDPRIKLYVVGHTDRQGELSHNLGVSKQRAAWLVKELTKQGVPASRLRADGVGPLAPIATNETEEGRAKNRRVELVRQ